MQDIGTDGKALGPLPEPALISTDYSMQGIPVSGAVAMSMSHGNFGSPFDPNPMMEFQPVEKVIKQMIKLIWFKLTNPSLPVYFYEGQGHWLVLALGHYGNCKATVYLGRIKRPAEAHGRKG